MNDEQYFGNELNSSPVAESTEAPHTIPVEKPETFAQEERANKNWGDSVKLDSDEADRLRDRWNQIQAKFVDEPRSSVSEADALVTEVIQYIAQKMNEQVRALESSWNQGAETSTEDLRQALQRYRSFFNNLLI